jgi:hypothetical protein
MTGAAISIKAENGYSFPFFSNAGTITMSTNVPSGKTVDASTSDWNETAEKVDACISGEKFNITWDNANLYIMWSGRNMEGNGDLFLYISTGAAGKDSTFDHAGYGSKHAFASTFRSAKYVYFYDNSALKGFKDGGSNWADAAFTGSISSNSSNTEVKIPFSDMGNPDTVRIIPFVQNESSPEIPASMPYDNVGELVRNRDGPPPLFRQIPAASWLFRATGFSLDARAAT